MHHPCASYPHSRGFGKADPARGHFCALLLAAIRNFLWDAWDRERAQKRGGGVRTISSEELSSWECWVVESDGQLAPEAVYDRNWVIQVVAQ